MSSKTLLKKVFLALARLEKSLTLFREEVPLYDEKNDEEKTNEKNGYEKEANEKNYEKEIHDEEKTNETNDEKTLII